MYRNVLKERHVEVDVENLPIFKYWKKHQQERKLASASFCSKKKWATKYFST